MQEKIKLINLDTTKAQMIDSLTLFGIGLSYWCGNQ